MFPRCWATTTRWRTCERIFEFGIEAVGPDTLLTNLL